MSKMWIGSDFHWGHQNIMKFCPDTRARFSSVSDMDEWMIREWNNTVSGDDIVYMLGDVAFCNAEKATDIMYRLNGKKILIKGNHDEKNLKKEQFRKCFESIHDYYEMTYEGTKIVMFHYPIHEWNGCHRGAVHFYGHTHNNKTGIENYKTLNVGFDSTESLLLEFERAVFMANRGELRTHH